MEDQETLECSDNSLGYVYGRSEELLHVAAEEFFAGLELAVCANGIVGMGMMTNTGVSAWVGYSGDGGADVAYGKLYFDGQLDGLDLAASFDVSIIPPEHRPF